jgi:hypothetical protein
MSSPSYLSRHDKVVMRKGTGNKYEMPCCGFHKILKVITIELYVFVLASLLIR